MPVEKLWTRGHPGVTSGLILNAYRNIGAGIEWLMIWSVAGSCENGTEFEGFYNDAEYFYQLSDYELFIDPAVWS